MRDWRGEARGAYDPKKFNLGKDKRPKKRDMSKVDGVTLHQTACVFGPAADPERRYRRALGIPYHCLVYNDGTAVLSHPFEHYTYHGNGLNARSLGFAVEGHFPGFQKDFRMHTHQEPTEAQSDAARRALKAVVEMARAEGAPIKHLFAHRQSSKNRAGDPGEYWFRLLSRFARDELGMEVLPLLVVGDGNALDPRWL